MIYTTGTISIDGNTATGTGTNWTAAGSLIRVGCTVIVMSSPAQVFQITAVNSATGLTVSPAASPALSGQKYAILLSDSLSVDGLAQDIAEVVRMYQENMSGFADVMNGTDNVVITVNGEQKTVPGQLSLARKDDPRFSTIEGKSGGTLTSDLRVWPGKTIGVTTVAGGNKDIYLVNTTGDESDGNYVNYMRMWFYTGNVTLGAVRGAGENITRAQFSVSSSAGGEAKDFGFYPSYGGYIDSGRYKSNSPTVGGWGLHDSYMQAPVWIDTVFGNNNSFVPFISGGSQATGGYRMRGSVGLISKGETGWPAMAFSMIGDSAYTRTFEFTAEGTIYTWNGGGFPGETYLFTKSPASDRDIKRDINYVEGEESFNNIMALKPATFIYKSDKYDRVRRGLIAQDAMEVDDEYVQLVPGGQVTEEDEARGMKQQDDTLSLDTNVLLLDAIIALRYLAKKVEDRDDTITDLIGRIEKLEKTA